MAKDFPDYFFPITIHGWDGTELKVVRTDNLGQLLAVLQGTSLITGAVNATDLNTLKQIQGIEGVTYRTIAVDSLGQLIAIMKSAAGNNVVVDASGFLSTILKGTYAVAGDKNIAVDSLGQLIAIMKSAAGNNVVVDASGFLSTILKGTYAVAGDKNIAVDADGKIISIVKALYGTTLKDVQTDAGGNLTLNLKAQDLAELVTLEKYGNIMTGVFYTAYDTAGLKTLLSVAGKGRVLWYSIRVQSTISRKAETVLFSVDGRDISTLTWRRLGDDRDETVLSHNLKGHVYDDVNFIYEASDLINLVFSSSFVLYYYVAYNTLVRIWYQVAYTVV